MRAKIYCAILLFSGLSFFCSVGTFNYLIDPYWLWHNKVVWQQQDSPSLDNNMRLVKALQLIVRRPTFMIIGSSRIYHSLDPIMFNLPLEIIYNAGISGLTITEAAGYVAYAVKWLPMRTIVYGLDFFAFNDNQIIPGFDTHITQIDFIIENIFSALVGYDTTKASWNLLVHKNKPLDGVWQYMGYKMTPKRSKAEVDAGVLSLREGDYAKPNYFGVGVFDKLQSIIDTCGKGRIKLILFFSPLNYRDVTAIKQAGRWRQFCEWKKRVRVMARENGVPLFDFAYGNSVTQRPFLTGREIKSNPYYLDASHYSPLTAKLIMEKIGLPVQNQIALPPDFGRLLRATHSSAKNQSR